MQPRGMGARRAVIGSKARAMGTGGAGSRIRTTAQDSRRAPISRAGT